MLFLFVNSESGQKIKLYDGCNYHYKALFSHRELCEVLSHHCKLSEKRIWWLREEKAKITTIIASLPEHLLFSTKRSPGWCWLAIRRGDKRVQRCTNINVETALLYLSNRHCYVCVHFHLKSTSSMNEVGTTVKTGCALTDMQHNAVQLLHNSLTMHKAVQLLHNSLTLQHTHAA